MNLKTFKDQEILHAADLNNMTNQIKSNNSLINDNIQSLESKINANTNLINNNTQFLEEKITTSIQTAKTEMEENMETSIQTAKTQIENNVKDNIQDAKTQIENNVNSSIQTAKTEIEDKVKGNIQDVKTEIKNDVNLSMLVVETEIEDIKTQMFPKEYELAYTINYETFEKGQQGATLLATPPYYVTAPEYSYAKNKICYTDFDLLIYGGYEYKFILEFNDKLQSDEEKEKIKLGFYFYNENYKEEVGQGVVTPGGTGQNYWNDLIDPGWQSSGFTYEAPYYINGSKIAGVRIIISGIDLTKENFIQSLKIYKKNLTLKNYFTIMSYNVANWNTYQGKRNTSVFNTCDYCDTLINKYQPDIICWQEDSMGVGIQDDYGIQSLDYHKSLISYRIHDIYENRTQETPNIIGTQYQIPLGGNQIVKKFTTQKPNGARNYNYIKVNLLGRKIGIFNIHAEWEYEYNAGFNPDQIINGKTRLEHCKQNSVKIAQIKEVFEDAIAARDSGEINEFIIAGDFNTLINSTNSIEYRAIREQLKEEYRDCEWANKDFKKTWWGKWSGNGTADGTIGYYDGNGYAGEETDHIVVSPGLQVLDFSIDNEKILKSQTYFADKWVEHIDHLPIIAKISIK